MGLPYRLTDYIELVDWTERGRKILKDRRTAIEAALPPILKRLHLDPNQWLYLTQRIKSQVGTVFKLKRACKSCLLLFVLRIVSTNSTERILPSATTCVFSCIMNQGRNFQRPGFSVLEVCYHLE
jgi:hypothetical protein